MELSHLARFLTGICVPLGGPKTINSLFIMNKLLKNKKGSALVEYGLLIAGVALVSAAAVSVFGHKTNDLISATASILPGAHDDDNGAIVSGKLIETTRDAANGDGIIVDANAAGNATPRLGNNLLGATFNQTGVSGNVLGSTLVIEAN
jgi:pilus assembly protein Flp/PilA